LESTSSTRPSASRRSFARDTGGLYCPAVADTSIPEQALASFVDALDKANVAAAERFPGELPKRQPVHTVYGGAHLFARDTPQKLGQLALRALEEYAPDAPALADALGFERDLASRLYPRIEVGRAHV